MNNNNSNNNKHKYLQYLNKQLNNNILNKQQYFNKFKYYLKKFNFPLTFYLLKI